MCLTPRTSTANCKTERQFKSECTTTLAMLRWTNSSPGSNPNNSFAGTRLSEQPIHKYSGFCCAASFLKKSASLSHIACAHRRLFSNNCAGSILFGFGLPSYCPECETGMILTASAVSRVAHYFHASHLTPNSIEKMAAFLYKKNE